MSPMRVAVALCIVMMAVLLVAGCVGEPVAENRTGNVPLTITIPSTVTTTILTSVISIELQCPPKATVPNSIISGEPFFFHSQIQYQNNSRIHGWLFGSQTAIQFIPDVNPSDKSNLTIPHEVTWGLSNGTYHIFFQYPNNAGHFDIETKNQNFPNWVLNKNGDLILDLEVVRKGGMTGVDAANILEKAINASGGDQKVDRSTINVTKAWIHINPIGNHTIGEKFPINGTTNLFVGDEIYFDDIHPTNYHPSLWPHGVAAPYLVREGICGNHIWSIEVDSSTFKPDEYFFVVQDYVHGAYAYQQFHIYALTTPFQNQHLQ